MTKVQNEIIKINGIDMYFEVHGEGKPLIILHGFTGSGAGLAELFKTLLPAYQLIIPDLRGHGKSTNPNLTKQFLFKESAQDVYALLDYLKIDNCSGIGFSGGALTLLHMAYAQPERINSMAIVSAAPYFPQSTRDFMKLVTIEDKTEEEWNAMREIHFHGDEQIKMLWQQAHDFSKNQDDMNFTPEMLSQIKTKTLIIQGDRDPIYPIELAIELFKNIKNSYLWILPNSGHGPITTILTPELISKFKELESFR